MVGATIELGSLLCSRLCHDLMSPVGALGNGLELLADETDEAMRRRCLELIADSQRASADKLKFFRLAFGAGGGFGAAIPAVEVRQALEGLIHERKAVTLGWLVSGDGLARDRAKVLLNLGLIAFEALVRGGQLDVAAEGDEVVIRAEGARLRLDPAIRAVLAGEGDAVPEARTAPAWLVRGIVEASGGQLQIADGEAGMLLIAATLPG